MKAQNKGLIKGYKPNRLSLYILLLHTNRIDELNELLHKDMQKYKQEK
jgi:serine protease inhibitor